MTAFILNLAYLGKDNLPRAGGKGANLGELAGNGFPIPPGFVISTDACRLFFEAAAIDRMIGYVFLYIVIFGAYHLVFAWNAKSMKAK